MHLRDEYKRTLSFSHHFLIHHICRSYYSQPKWWSAISVQWCLMALPSYILRDLDLNLRMPGLIIYSYFSDDASCYVWSGFSLFLKVPFETDARHQCVNYCQVPEIVSFADAVELLSWSSKLRKNVIEFWSGVIYLHAYSPSCVWVVGWLGRTGGRVDGEFGCVCFSMANMLKALTVEFFVSNTSGFYISDGIFW